MDLKIQERVVVADRSFDPIPKLFNAVNAYPLRSCRCYLWWPGDGLRAKRSGLHGGNMTEVDKRYAVIRKRM